MFWEKKLKSRTLLLANVFAIFFFHFYFLETTNEKEKKKNFLNIVWLKETQRYFFSSRWWNSHHDQQFGKHDCFGNECHCQGSHCIFRFVLFFYSPIFKPYATLPTNAFPNLKTVFCNSSLGSDSSSCCLVFKTRNILANRGVCIPVT